MNIKKTLTAARLLVVAVFTLGALSACGDDDGKSSGSNRGEQILAAIEGTWDVPLGGLPSDAQAELTDPKITITRDGSDVSIAPDTSSGLDKFIASGAFSVNDEGKVSGASIVAAPESELSFSDPTINATTDLLEISFSTSESQARGEGVGFWSIVIDL